ncbi:MAG: substrate-binding domain-containing protein [Lachnospirales bacterium]
MAKVTIKDVAREAGVSVGSVHLAINSKSGITKKNRDHILEVANNLGYKPNILARNLKREIRNIAVVLPRKDDRSIYYYDYMWRAVEDFQSIASDYNLNIVKYEYSNFSKTLGLVDLSSISGLITVGYPEEHYKEAISRVCHKGIPVILIDCDFKDSSRICCIKPDSRIIGRLTGELLVKTIHRMDGQILVCGGDRNYSNHYEIVNSLLEYFNEMGIGNRLMVEYFWKIEEESEKIITRALKNNNIVGCCSVNSRSTVALSQGIIKNGMSQKIPVIGNGIFSHSIKFMKEGVITAIIDKRPYEQCYKALETMSDLLVKNNSPSEEIVDIGVDVIFKSLLEQYEKKALKI